MNKGYIFGIVKRGGRPVRDAIIGLDWIRSLSHQNLPIYREDVDSNNDRYRALSRGVALDMPRPIINFNTQTDSDGYFMLSFQWSGTDLGTAFDNLRSQIFVLIEEGNTMRLQGRFPCRMRSFVNVSQVSSGLIPDLTNPYDLVGTGIDIYAIFRHFRKPMIGVTVAAPSPDMYSIYSAYNIEL